MDSNFLKMWAAMSPEERAAMLEPFSQEQDVIDREMALAEQLRRPSGQEYSNPLAAALGGLSDAAGNIGGAVLQRQGLDTQRAIGGRMTADAVGRFDKYAEMERQKALEEFLRQRSDAMGMNGPGINYGV